jgi:hypothetical protein
MTADFGETIYPVCFLEWSDRSHPNRDTTIKILQHPISRVWLDELVDPNNLITRYGPVTVALQMFMQATDCG